MPISWEGNTGRRKRGRLDLVQGHLNAYQLVAAGTIYCPERRSSLSYHVQEVITGEP